MDKKVSKEYVALVPFLGNYKAGYHIRKIAREMKMNHRTISLALKRLEDESIVKHRIEGRNKVFYLNPENPRTKKYIENAEFYIQGLALNNPLIKELYLSVNNTPTHDTPVILFGSYAKGESRKKSDIDLLLLGKNDKILNSIKRFELKYAKKVHSLVLSRKEFESGLKRKEPLYLEIIADHIILNNGYVFVNIFYRHFYG